MWLTYPVYLLERKFGKSHQNCSRYLRVYYLSYIFILHNAQSSSRQDSIWFSSLLTSFLPLSISSCLPIYFHSLWLACLEFIEDPLRVCSRAKFRICSYLFRNKSSIVRGKKNTWKFILSIVCNHRNSWKVLLYFHKTDS